MYLTLKKLLLASTLAVAALATNAHAQLLLSGNAYGVFADPALPHTTVTNGPIVSIFSSGTPFRPAAPFFDTPTSISFFGSSFTDVGDGGALDLGFLKIKNGITLLGTTASTATMDLYLNFSSAGISGFKLTTLTFGIDNTANNGVGNIPDLFLIGYTDPASLWIGTSLVTFDLVFSDPTFVTGLGHNIPENTTAFTGDLFAHVTEFNPVPEPSTYAMGGALLLLGVVAWRRGRGAVVTAA